MTFSGAEYARDVIAEIAHTRELVCYDPQVERLLPDPNAPSASSVADLPTRRWTTISRNRVRPVCGVGGWLACWEGTETEPDASAHAAGEWAFALSVRCPEPFAGHDVRGVDTRQPLTRHSDNSGEKGDQGHEDPPLEACLRFDGQQARSSFTGPRIEYCERRPDAVPVHGGDGGPHRNHQPDHHGPSRRPGNPSCHAKRLTAGVGAPRWRNALRNLVPASAHAARPRGYEFSD